MTAMVSAVFRNLIPGKVKEFNATNPLIDDNLKSRLSTNWYFYLGLSLTAWMRRTSRFSLGHKRCSIIVSMHRISEDLRIQIYEPTGKMDQSNNNYWFSNRKCSLWILLVNITKVFIIVSIRLYIIVSLQYIYEYEVAFNEKQSVTSF